MMAKPKLVVVAITAALVIFIVWFLADGIAARNRREAERITIRQGVILIGTANAEDHPRPHAAAPISFNVAIGMEIAARLGLRAAFITTDRDSIFTELETGIFDIIISSVTITPERQTVHNFSKPYMANIETTEPYLFAITLRKGTDVLIAAINRALEDMFNDETMLQISMNILGVDMVTQARQVWQTFILYNEKNRQ